MFFSKLASELENYWTMTTHLHNKEIKMIYLSFLTISLPFLTEKRDLRNYSEVIKTPHHEVEWMLAGNKLLSFPLKSQFLKYLFTFRPGFELRRIGIIKEISLD